MNPLSLLSGGVGGGISASSQARSGDSSAGLELPFNYNGAFQVGGSGSQSQDAGLSTSAGGGNALVYVGIAIGAIGLIIGVLAMSKK